MAMAIDCLLKVRKKGMEWGYLKNLKMEDTKDHMKMSTFIKFLARISNTTKLS